MLEVVVATAAALVCLPSVTLAVEILAAAALKNPVRLPGRSVRPGTIAVIVPAHNEGAGILATLQDITPQLRPGDRLLVVADNCTDNTAAVARAAGAEVSERHDPERRGKGYALDWGVRHLRQDPPEAVVIIDADCRVAPGSILTLTEAALAAGRPTQAFYAMRAAPWDPRRRVQEFAWALKNHVRPLGLARLGLPCQLMGTGMAFPWQVLTAVELASSHRWKTSSSVSTPPPAAGPRSSAPPPISRAPFRPRKPASSPSGGAGRSARPAPSCWKGRGRSGR